MNGHRVKHYYEGMDLNEGREDIDLSNEHVSAVEKLCVVGTSVEQGEVPNKAPMGMHDLIRKINEKTPQFSDGEELEVYGTVCDEEHRQNGEFSYGLPEKLEDAGSLALPCRFNHLIIHALVDTAIFTLN